jgi:hypothetical protein
MAFSADEVRVLRCALAAALNPRRGPAAPAVVVAPRAADYVPDCLRLADALDDAVREAARLRVFLLDELRRYRDALPGTAAGYLERLTAALAGGYVPGPDDLAGLRRLRTQPCGTPEHHRRTALLRRCEILAENDVRQRLEAHMPAPRRLLTFPGPTRLAEEPKPAPAPRPKPAPAAPEPAPEPQDPGRRTPTPAEIWPPHRRDRKPDEARSA